jgi:ABC-type sugar transport system permease subunit
MIAAVWGAIGFFFVILLAGLQNVDMDLMDAALVDGANSWQRFWNVVIPQLSHVLTMVTSLALIGGIKTFGLIWAITQGGPGNATEMIATYAYTEFSRHNEVGYSCALTMLMAAIAFGFTIIFIRLRERGEGV